MPGEHFPFQRCLSSEMLLFDIYFSFKNKTNNNLFVRLGELLGLKNSMAPQTWMGHLETSCWVRFILLLSQMSK